MDDCCNLDIHSSSAHQGCQKSFYIEGWMSVFVQQVKKQFSEQNEYIRKLEERTSLLEKRLDAKTLIIENKGE